MPDELMTFLTAMTPLGELRAAIPLGLVRYDIPAFPVFLLSVAGNLVPVPLLLFGLHKAGARVEGMANPLGTPLRWRTRQIKNRYGPFIRRRGFWAVMLLVAIPLPLTGAWTGCLAVWALHVPLRQGVAGIVLGVLVAGVVVTALSMAGIKVFSSLP
jgi:uncharacterized membrane protein